MKVEEVVEEEEESKEDTQAPALIDTSDAAAAPETSVEQAKSKRKSRGRRGLAG